MLNIKGIKVLLFLTLLYSCSGIKKSERLADNGNLSACHQVVQYYLDKMDYLPERRNPEKKIIKYSQKGVSLDSTSKSSLIFYLLLSNYANDRQLKHFYIRKAACLGDGESQWRMGIYYLEGQENERNKDSAIYYLKLSSIETNYKYAALANYELGNIFSLGKIIEKDSLLAMKYYKNACLCYGDNSHLPSCKKVISNYKKLNNKDTSEVWLYENVVKYLSLKEKYK